MNDDPVTKETIEAIVKQTMERTRESLRAEFDKEMIGYAEALEAGADRAPRHEDAPGLRSAAALLRKAVEYSNVPRRVVLGGGGKLVHKMTCNYWGDGSCNCGGPWIG